MLVKCKFRFTIIFIKKGFLLKFIFFLTKKLLNTLEDCTFAPVFHGIRFKVSKDWLSG